MTPNTPKLHTARAVAVVGASKFLGAHLVGQLSEDPTIERVVGIDSVKPNAQNRRRMRGAEFVRVDPQSPRLHSLLRQHEIDTVVHVALRSNTPDAGGRAAVKETNIMGSMHVIAACGRAHTVRRVVLQSSTSVYGSSGKDPAMFNESTSALRSPTGGIPHDFLTAEGYVRAMSRKRPNMDVTILRMAPILGVALSNAIDLLLQPAVSPVLAGYDPRIQLLHPEDALGALTHSTLHGPTGTFNIAGDGVMTLIGAVRRAGHIPLPVVPVLFTVLSRVLGSEGLERLSSSQLQYLRYGRVVDTRRMREVLGFTPRFSTAEALDSYLESAGIEPIVTRESIVRMSVRFLDGLPDQWQRAILVGAASGRATEHALKMEDDRDHLLELFAEYDFLDRDAGEIEKSDTGNALQRMVDECSIYDADGSKRENVVDADQDTSEGAT